MQITVINEYIKKISVVIPTLWKGKELALLLPILETIPCIEEIIVINNSPANTPSWFKDTTSSKIVEIQQAKNISVNPSWNLGIEQSKAEIVCLLSDDILFDPAVFNYVSKHFEEENDGPIGPSGIVNHNMLGLSNVQIPSCAQVSLDSTKPKMPYGWGCLIFVKKADFIPIPPEFLVYFGDEWIWQSHQKRGKTPRTLENFVLKTTDHSSTIEIMRSPYYGHEFNIYPQLFPGYLNSIK
jgi:glycosyltransferase involved in cell wall biosynthesis